MQVAHNTPVKSISEGPLNEKGRLSGVSRSEQMFEHISIISNNFRTFFQTLHRVNIQDCRQ